MVVVDGVELGFGFAMWILIFWFEGGGSINTGGGGVFVARVW